MEIKKKAVQWCLSQTVDGIWHGDTTPTVSVIMSFCGIRGRTYVNAIDPELMDELPVDAKVCATCQPHIANQIMLHAALRP